MRTTFKTVSILCALFLPGVVWAQDEFGVRRPSERDLEPPVQDLVTLEGEIVWIQGTLLRGDPTPYRDLKVPLSTYEQGLLDEEGQLWTILDSPKGRELRYNPELRGQRVELKGWIYPDSKIVNVKSWGDDHEHPARINEDYPEPERIPFKEENAEQIESIKPAAPKAIQIDLLDNMLWKIQEGIDLSETGGPVGVQIPESEDSGRLQEILQDEGLIPARSEETQEKEGAPDNDSSEGVKETPSSTGSASHRPVPKPEAPSPRSSLQSKILNDRGEPLARPEEFDEALQESLFE